LLSAAFGCFAWLWLQEGAVAADNKAKFLQDAEKYVLNGKVQQAIGEYQKVVKSDPGDVLILNTIGDLYLSQGNSSEANKCFSQVAENYVQNNFFLKAIAVYKKILKADPDNLAINATIASLYAKQGLSIDARNQYMRVAGLLEQEGKTREQLDAYEKVVELDPQNSTIQQKLAELYFSEGSKDKALAHWLGAARAQRRSGDFAGSADSFGRVIQLNPVDLEAMQGLMECYLKLDNPASALDQLTRSVDLAPERIEFRELLGQAHLANKDPEAAFKVFQVVISMDGERYRHLFDVGRGFIDKGEFDRAAECLDSIIPTLISHRETERAAKLYQEILQSNPGNILPLLKMATLYSATGDQARYVSTLDQIADNYIQEGSPVEAVEYLEKILKITPGSKKHRNLHRQVFSDAYPDRPYVEPSEPPEPALLVSPVPPKRETSDQQLPPEIVEVDLLLNYGMIDKALGLLKRLETRDPYDKEARLRLLSIYKGERENAEAAKQSLLLAVLHRKANNEEAALSCLAEARQLSPEVVERERDLDAFAKTHGIERELSVNDTPAADAQAPGAEVDLSSDLLNIFFSGEQGATEEYRESNDEQEEIAESLPQGMGSSASPKSVEEQLQEVDFYIRLGFEEEALAKLNEIAKAHPENPELDSRYEKLAKSRSVAAEAPAPKPQSEPPFGKFAAPSDPMDSFSDLDLEDALGQFAQRGEFQETECSEAIEAPDSAALEAERNQPASIIADLEEPETDDFQATQMFADLMEGIGAPSDGEVLKESFEDHFSLGTAYRDMELNEEAIREFQFALKIADLKKDTRRVVQCCGMLSTCFLKKSMPSSAVRWCQTGLKVKHISSHEAMALRYDMGVAHSMSGSNERALECFDEIFSLDPGYRDVAQKIDELRSQPGSKGGFDKHAP
jgi:tetratricopeptide (TPR) repeat protein